MEDSKATTLQEVTYAKLHAPLFFPSPDGKGNNFKETLTAVGQDAGMKMYLDGTFLRLYVRGVKVAVPLTNVVAMVLK